MGLRSLGKVYIHIVAGLQSNNWAYFPGKSIIQVWDLGVKFYTNCSLPVLIMSRVSYLRYRLMFFFSQIEAMSQRNKSGVGEGDAKMNGGPSKSAKSTGTGKSTWLS